MSSRLKFIKDRQLELMVFNNLSKHIPGLKAGELEGEWLVHVALQDLENYVKSQPRPTNASWEAYLEYWIERWVDKWRERVKLAIGLEDLKIFEAYERLVKETKLLWSKFPNLREALELVVDALVSVSEICFTNLMAESLLRKELYECRRRCKSDGEVLRKIEENPLEIVKIVKSAIRAAKNLKESKGHLILLKVDERVLKTSTGRIVELSEGEVAEKHMEAFQPSE